MPIEPQQDAVIIRKLKGGEHVGGGGAAGEHVAPGLALQAGVQVEEGHSGAQGRLLLEIAVAHLDIHGLHQVGHLLPAPHQLLVGGGGDGDEDRHIEQVLVVAGQALLDVVAGLDGACQLLVVGGGVLEATQLGAVEPDALCDPVDGPAPDLTAQVQVHIHPLPGVDEGGHPAAPHPLGVAVLADVEVGVVGPVHDDVAGVCEVQTAGGHEVDCLDMGDRVQPDDPLLGRHSVHHHPVQPGGEGVVHAGAAVEVHVEDLRQGGVLVLGLDDAVAALGEVGAGILRRRLERGVDLAVVGAHLPSAGGGLVLENEEEPA